jgi:hypothetical protein
MQTTNVEGGTETIFHCNLGAPIQKAGALAAPNYANGDDLLLLKTKTSNRITGLKIINNSGIQFAPSFFFAFLNDGKVVFPRYSSAVGAAVGGYCYYSLGCSIATDHIIPSGFTIDAIGCVELWDFAGPDINGGIGGLSAVTWRIAPVAAAVSSAIRPQLEPNIGSIMDKTLRANVGERGALAVNANGLAQMSAIDTDVLICMHIGAAGLTQAQASRVHIVIKVIETDTSARNETEEYVKSWTQIPANGIFDGDGLRLSYNP